MSKFNHLYNACTGAAVSFTGYAAFTVGSAAGGSIPVSLFAMSAIGSTILVEKFNFHSALTGFCSGLALTFGMSAYDLNANHINIPINNDMRNVMEARVTSKQALSKIGQEAVSDFIAEQHNIETNTNIFQKGSVSRTPTTP